MTSLLNHPWVSWGIISLLASLGAAALLIIPVIVVQYRKWGTLSASRMFLLYGFLVYLIALPMYTISVPPGIDFKEFCQVPRQRLDLTPFRFIEDFREAGVFSNGLRGMLKNSVFLQVAFNVVLFIPLGLFLRKLFRWPVLATLAAGFLMSVGIEVTQYTGNFGFAPCSYRFAEADDVLTNTTGTLIGVLLSPLLSVFPGVHLKEEHATLPRPVTRRRRLIQLFVDAALLLGAVFAARLAISALLVFGKVQVTEGEGRTIILAASAVIFLLLLVVVPARAQGATLGELAVRIQPRRLVKDPSGQPAWRSPGVGRALVKLAAGPWLFFLLLTFSGEGYPPLLTLAYSVFCAVTVVGVLVSPHGLSCAVAGLRMSDEREPVILGNERGRGDVVPVVNENAPLKEDTP